MHTFGEHGRQQKKVCLTVERLLWSRARLRHVLCPNGDGWERGRETDVHESCQPLPITNATSPPDRMEIAGRDSVGKEGRCGGYRQNLWPSCGRTSCFPTPAISVDHILLIGLYCLAHTEYLLNYISEMACSQWGGTFAGALSCGCVMIDKCFKTEI